MKFRNGNLPFKRGGGEAVAVPIMVNSFLGKSRDNRLRTKGTVPDMYDIARLHQRGAFIT